MKKVVYMEKLQKRFPVDVRFVTKDMTSRSFATASDCCGVRVVQKKFCSNPTCNKEVKATEAKRKIVSLHKEEFLIDAAQIKAIVEALDEQEEIIVKETMPREELPDDLEDRFGKLMKAVPVTKREAEYAELSALFSSRVGIASVVINGNDYEALLYAGKDGVLRMRLLIDDEMHHELPDVELAMDKVSEPVLAMEQRILQKSQIRTWDFSAHKNKRREMEDTLIERAIVKGDVPSPMPIEVLAQTKEKDELARLKALEVQV
jgi:hypothetical protein